MNCSTSREIRRYNYLIGEINAVYHEMALKLGVSDSVMAILYTICDRGDCCLLQEICRCSGLSKQTINSAIRKLEREGVAYLEPAGGKNKNVCLTEKGKQLAGQTAAQIIDAENEVFASWPEEDVNRYLALTERFLENVREKAKFMGRGR